MKIGERVTGCRCAGAGFFAAGIKNENRALHSSETLCFCMSIIGFACSGASCSHCSEIRMKQFRSSRRLFAQRELLGECQNALLLQLLLSRLLRRLYAAATYSILLVADCSRYGIIHDLSVLRSFPTDFTGNTIYYLNSTDFCGIL